MTEPSPLVPDWDDIPEDDTAEPADADTDHAGPDDYTPRDAR